jgi:phenylalanyl-tRNA synthetase alpha chain
MSHSEQTLQLPLEQELQKIKAEAETRLSSANDIDALEAIRVEYVGRKGRVTGLMRGLKDVPNEERPRLGALANEINDALSSQVEARIDSLKNVHILEKLSKESLDVTMPGHYTPQGTTHPLTLVTQEICHIFQGMGFQVLDDHVCPEVETEFYNFDALNFPQDHPARDMQDTYYTHVGELVLLRSQTSNNQIRFMEQAKPPFRIVAPGRVYRNEEVSSRKSVLFHQLEGLMVAEHVRFSDLKGVLHEFIKHFFKGERPTRFRNSFFPFTEPSAEVDVQCILCQGNGCRTCGQHGWLEILGAGMVDPNVLQGVGIDPEKYVGFAFGMGIERLAMLKYAIQDIRSFYTNDIRFLEQFKGD